MKKIGIFIFALGLVITIVTGFKYITRENVVDFGDLKISHQNNQFVTWSPVLGVLVMAIGGGVLLIGYRRGK